MTKLVIYSITFLLFVFCVSCDNDFVVDENQNLVDGNEEEDVVAIDGVLHFGSLDAYYRTSKNVLAMSYSEREEWEKQMNFTSLNTFLNDLADEYDYSEELISLYPQYFVEEDSVTTCSVPFAYSVIANKNGLFYIQGVIHKVDGTQIAYVRNGTENLVSRLINNEAIEGLGYGVSKHETPVTNHLKSTPQEEKLSKITSDAICRDGYKCYFSVRLYTSNVSDNISNSKAFFWEVKVENRKRKLGKYREHHAVSAYRNVEFSCDVPYLGISNSYMYHTYYDWRNDRVVHVGRENSNKELVTFVSSDYFSFTDIKDNVAPYFTYLKGEASSNEVGWHYTSINYNVL